MILFLLKKLFNVPVHLINNLWRINPFHPRYEYHHLLKKYNSVLEAVVANGKKIINHFYLLNLGLKFNSECTIYHDAEPYASQTMFSYKNLRFVFCKVSENNYKLKFIFEEDEFKN